MGSSCGGERTAGVHLRLRLAVTLPWLFLRRRRCFSFVGAFARTPVAAARTVTAVAAVSEAVTPVAVAETIATVAPAVVAVAITLRPAHHGRRALFVLLNPDGEIAQHVFIETLQPLDLGDRR